MIRYPVSLEKIEADIEIQARGWRRRTQRRTDGFVRLGRYEEKSSAWDQVKPVYMKLQYNKCIYCEQQLEGGPRGKINHDLEHFRPKSSVGVWPRPSDEPLSFPTGDPIDPGYYRLAYHPGNYATSCKPCNSLLKLNFFPITRTRITDGENPEDYAAERPYLPYPIGPIAEENAGDEDPERLITFVFSDDGPLAVPRYTEDENPVRYRRGLVAVRFFDLNRADLLYSRAFVLLAVWETFKNAERGDPGSVRRLEIYTSPRAPHTSCSRCFVAFCRSLDRGDIERHYLPILERIVYENNAG